MKKICALVLLLGGLAVAPGCGDDECKGDRRHYIDITGLIANNVARQDTSFDSFSNQYQVLTPATIIEAKKFGVELRANVSYYARLNTTSGSLGQTYACSPTVAGQNGSKEEIAEIIITSNADFNSAHPAGTNLNEFFRLTGFNDYNQLDDSLFYTAIPVNTFLAYSPKARQNIYFWLTQRPETALSHRFTVIYRQTNGEEYTVTTPLVTFQ